MNGLSKINLKEDIPLKLGSKTTVFVNADKNIVYLNEKRGGGGEKMDNPTILEINTNIPSSIQPKKVKCGIILCVSVSILSVVLSMALAYHHCMNMSALKNQVEMMLLKMENMSNNHRQWQESLSTSQSAELKSYHSKLPSEDNVISEGQPSHNFTLSEKDFLVIQFHGAQQEVNLGMESIIGPWVRDVKISSPDSHTKIELEDNFFIVKESGLYMIYAQVVYLTQDPCCYFVWARQHAGAPRLLTTCSTGNDSSARPLSKSQMSCATQTVARLYKNDIINLSQREHNRTLWMRPGYSYFGFIKIGS